MKLISERKKLIGIQNVIIFNPNARELLRTARAVVENPVTSILELEEITGVDRLVVWDHIRILEDIGFTFIRQGNKANNMKLTLDNVVERKVQVNVNNCPKTLHARASAAVSDLSAYSKVQKSVGTFAIQNAVFSMTQICRALNLKPHNVMKAIRTLETKCGFSFTITVNEDKEKILSLYSCSYEPMKKPKSHSHNFQNYNSEMVFVKSSSPVCNQDPLWKAALGI